MSRNRPTHGVSDLERLKAQFGDTLHSWIVQSYKEDGSSETSKRGWWTVDGILKFIEGQQQLFGLYKHRVQLTVVVFDGYIWEGENEDSEP